MAKAKIITLGLAILTTGLSAGLFYAYSVSINPAFTHLSDTEYIAAMQAINVAIQNPLFFCSFMGALIFLPLAAFLHRGERSSPKFRLLVASALLYVIGTFGITIAANIPMNETLSRFSVQTSTPQQIAAARADFAQPWNTWHTLRTVTAVVAFVAVVGAGLSPNTQLRQTNKNKENV